MEKDCSNNPNPSVVKINTYAERVCAADKTTKKSQQTPPIITKTIALASIDVPEYYADSIPPALKPVYDVLGVKFVRVRSSGVNPKDYYILSTNLVDVVERLGLFA